MEFGDAEKHIKACWNDDGTRPEEVWGEAVKKVVERRAEEAREVREWVLWDKTIQKPSFLRETLWFLDWLGRNLGCCQ